MKCLYKAQKFGLITGVGTVASFAWSCRRATQSLDSSSHHLVAASSGTCVDPESVRVDKGD